MFWFVTVGKALAFRSPHWKWFRVPECHDNVEKNCLETEGARPNSFYYSHMCFSVCWMLWNAFHQEAHWLKLRTRHLHWPPRPPSKVCKKISLNQSETSTNTLLSLEEKRWPYFSLIKDLYLIGCSRFRWSGHGRRTDIMSQEQLWSQRKLHHLRGMSGCHVIFSKSKGGCRGAGVGGWHQPYKSASWNKNKSLEHAQQCRILSVSQQRIQHVGHH